jgi:predicted DsbA family dithiol-disulfide isomerase
MTYVIDVHAWLDIACPWCWIAKRRFGLAVEDYGGPVRIDYHSFELAPHLPDDYLSSESDFLQSSHSHHTREQAREMMWIVRSTGVRLGLVYDFARVQHTSTLLAHHLLQHAKAQGMQDAMLEALFAAFFTQGRDLRQIEVLVGIADGVGLDAGDVRRVLISRRYRDAVRADRE